MDKKTIISILVLVILAIFISFIIFGKYNNNVTVPDNNILQEETSIENVIEEQVEIKESLIKQEEESVIIQPVKSTTVQIKKQEPVVEKLVVEEPVEEVQVDNGIQKNEGSDVIEITREFKFETPAKYSFK